MGANIHTDIFATENLYHYTRIGNAKSILGSLLFKLSKPCNQNDLNESFRDIIKCNDSALIPSILNILENYTQMSLTQDGRRKGFNISSMWGHYGDNGNGVCLVFYKAKLLDTVKRNTNVLVSPIKYVYSFESDYIFNGVISSIDEFFDWGKERLFFTKTDDWAHEQELRCICLDKNVCQLSIGKCLKAIILCPTSIRPRPFESDDYRDLKSLTRLPIFVLSKYLDTYLLKDNNGEQISPKPIENYAF